MFFLLKKPGFKKLAVRLITIFCMIGLPILTLYCSEVIVRQVLTMSFTDWRAGYEDRFIVNVLIMLALFNVFYIFPRKWFIFSGMVLSGLLLIFAFANKVKMEIRSSPISVEDFFLMDELAGIELPINLDITLVIGICAVFIGLSAAVFFGIPKVKENWFQIGRAHV